jgi:uncharacterized protein (TIGR00290 family)
MKKINSIFCWSGGKDSALCLHKIKEGKKYDVRYLLTTVNETYRRISMHGVREELLDMQAASIGIPLIKVYVKEGTNAEYEKKMEETLLKVKKKAVSHVIFGDIFLEDLRKYREENLARVDMQAVFPLWKQDTRQLVGEFLSLGFKTITCCVNDARLGEEHAGIVLNPEFISSLPPEVDPCGENGEFHTFAFEGPLFSKPIRFKTGEKIYKPVEVRATDIYSLPASKTKGFWYCDLVPLQPLLG